MALLNMSSACRLRTCSLSPSELSSDAIPLALPSSGRREPASCSLRNSCAETDLDLVIEKKRIERKEACQSVLYSTPYLEGKPGLRNVHAMLGSGIMTLFLVHAALGLQLGLSY